MNVVLDQVFTEYYIDGGLQTSETTYPRNQVVVFKDYPPGEEKPEVRFARIGKNIDGTGKNEYKLGIVDYEMHHVSGITVRRDYTIPLFIVGAAIFMIGVIQGMYWQHRRIWVHPKNGSVLLAAHTNKNWFGIKKDIEAIIEDTTINMVEDQHDLHEDQ